MRWSFRKRPPPVTLPDSKFDPLQIFADCFAVAGSVILESCPVCDSPDIGRLWQLPQTRLGASTHLDSPGSAYHGVYLDYLPLLTAPQEIFVFDICRSCHSVFRNPKDDDHAGYREDTSKVRAFKSHGVAPFDDLVERCEKHFPRNTKVVVDAACGAGQALALLRDRHAELRLIGLDLSGPSVKHMTSLGMEASVVDLDFEELDPFVAPGTADFVIFYEGFEHVRRPLVVLHKLLRLLRRGGRLHFSAQYYGPRSSLPVRVGEPIYIDRHGLDWILSRLDARLYDLLADTKFRVTLEKK